MAPYSDKKLRIYSDRHLRHELEMFRWLAGILPKKAESKTCSAFIESFAIHLRNLTDFFYVPPKGDDVAAIHFYDLPPRRWNRKRMPRDLRKAKERANKEISHLTKKRMGFKAKEKWWTENLYSNIRTAALDFAVSASPKKLSPNVAAFIKSNYTAKPTLDLTVGVYSPKSNIAM